MGYRDKEEERAYQREYYQQNREKRNEYQRKYNAEYGKYGISKKAEKKRESQKNTARRKAVMFRSQSKARLDRVNSEARVYTHSDLMKMPAEKLAKIIGRSDFEMTGVR